MTPPRGARLRSWIGDYAVIAAWLLVLTIAGLAARAVGWSSSAAGTGATDVVVTLGTVTSLTLRRAALRNLVKVAPWQLAHLAVARFILDVQLPLAVAAYAGSLVLLGAVAGPLLLGRRGLHDVLAGTQVRVARPVASTSVRG